MTNLIRVLFGIALILMAMFVTTLAGFAGRGAGQIILIVIAALIAVGGLLFCVVSITANEDKKPKEEQPAESEAQKDESQTDGKATNKIV